MSVVSESLKSSRVSRVGFEVAPKQSSISFPVTADKCESKERSATARTCSPARGRRALPIPAGGALVLALLIFGLSASSLAQADPASEPAVLAVAKVLPAVVNINTERVVRKTVRDPFDDFYAQFFGYNRFRPREVRQTL